MFDIGRRFAERYLQKELYQLKCEREKLESDKKDHEWHIQRAKDDISREQSWHREALDRAKRIEQYVSDEKALVASIVDDAMKKAPHAASMIADCVQAYDMVIAEELRAKDHPAIIASEKVKEISRAKRESEKLYRLHLYRMSVLESLFPWVSDMVDMSISDIKRMAAPVKDVVDYDSAIMDYVSAQEWKSLSDAQRHQLALDRYVASHKKTKWEIGRDYELYIGHTFSKDGYHVDYTGSRLRLEDLGRDLIVRKGSSTMIVQCKYWSQEKEIHEKHLFQLFGTSVCYQIDHPRENVSCVFVTATRCSDSARAFAKKLGIVLKENVPLSEFPRIKCNISHDGERIYHLPMDQQYDNVVIDKPDECFVFTVQEAIDKGFRRAFRWHG